MLDPKVLLFPIVGSADMPARFHGALQVAEKLGAHLQVLQSVVRPHQFLPDDLALPDSTMENLALALAQHADGTLAQAWEDFQRICAERGVKITDSVSAEPGTASWLQEQGLRSVSVARHGKVADMILVSRPPDGRVSATLRSALLETGRPVLLLPRTIESFDLEHVLVAWNCSAPAARAVQAALPVLQRSKAVDVVTSKECASRKPDAEAVAAHLQRHGVSADAHVIDCEPSNAGPALVRHAKARGSSILVMGAYSSHRVSELVFGGVTQHMVAHGELPILMAH